MSSSTILTRLRGSFCVLILLALAFMLPGCHRDTPPAPPLVMTPTATIIPIPSASPSPTASPEAAAPVVISEVLAGVQGNNNLEFIELYNRDSQIQDLQGWALYYRLPSSTEDLLVHRWKSSTLIPPFGHYLLIRQGQSLEVVPDAEFDQSLNTASGGLQLRSPEGKVADILGWGDAPSGFYEGIPASAMRNGVSLERRPGGKLGSGEDTSDNAADFVTLSAPNPQNSGSPITPWQAQFIALELTAPTSIEPGSELSFTFSITNRTESDLEDAVISIAFPPDLILDELPPQVEAAQDRFEVHYELLPVNETRSIQLDARAPWSYTTLAFNGYYARAGNWPIAHFGTPVTIQVEGGVVPIETARTLLGAELTVEGLTSMYTGGFFAGSGNTKFYLQDETGGIQVQVFEGQGIVGVPMGARVRVRGKIDLYRGSVEIVPLRVPEDIQVLEPAPELDPFPVQISEALEDEQSLPGRLVQVTGTILRIDEYTYSYEIDLADAQGEILSLYIDKQTAIDVEDFIAGDELAASGILDVRDDRRWLYPRRQSDLQKIYPPELFLQAQAPIAIEPGETFTITLTATNHTASTLRNLEILSAIPLDTQWLSASPPGIRDGNRVIWQIESLPGDGASIQVSFKVRAALGVQQLMIKDYRISAPGYPEVVAGQPVYLFSSGAVPIWAIQGAGTRSPYVGELLTTRGIVTGIFPDLGGFWVQNPEPDSNPLTSEGLFIQAAEAGAAVLPGDLVEIFGKVREPAQQTTLVVTRPEDIAILSRGRALPTPADLDPPTVMSAALPYYEALEGMLVQVSGSAWAVSPVSQYGEFVVVLPYHNRPRLFQGEENGIMIMIDDGSSITHSDRTTLPYPINTGDTISAVIGPLAYTFGRYKIEPIAVPDIQPKEVDLPTLEPPEMDEFSLMTWNVENLFDILDPHPSDPPRPSLAEYKNALAKVANTILAAGAPTLIALQEVENLAILEDIAAHPNLAQTPYQPVLIEGYDSRGIDVGYLVRKDRASILEVKQLIAPEGLTSRPPLMLHLLVQTSAGETELFVINNHFTSMSGGVEITEPARAAQAAWNVQISQEILAEYPQAAIAILGDLNSFFVSRPIQALREAGFAHVMDALPAQERYTYIYQGESEVLDHILVTSNLYGILERVEILHVNADYAPAIPEDQSPLRKSDHDPLIATFKP